MGAAAEQCGFFGTAGSTSEASLRAAVRDVAVAERAKWFIAGSAVGDLDDGHFGHLLRYWLALNDSLRPPTLTYLYTRALSPSIAYGTLLDRHTTETAAKSAATTMATKLLTGAPAVGGPANIKMLVRDALFATWKTRQAVASPWQWSAVFVTNCVRGVAIKRGLEAVSGGAHIGRNVLLKASQGHRHYVKEAHKRRTSTPPVTGTYQAFRPSEAPVEVGDIVVGDREAGVLGDVVDFDDIPTISDDKYNMHGDIVVAVTATYAEAIGGNIGYSDPIGGDRCNQPDSLDPFNVRRRRYPLTTTGNLVVDLHQRYVQENNSGQLPPLPVACSSSVLHARSMGRMFTVLKPVAHCETS